MRGKGMNKAVFVAKRIEYSRRSLLRTVFESIDGCWWEEVKLVFPSRSESFFIKEVTVTASPRSA